MLIPAAICGLVVFIYGLVTMNNEDNYPVYVFVDLIQIVLKIIFVSFAGMIFAIIVNLETSHYVLIAKKTVILTL